MDNERTSLVDEYVDSVVDFDAGPSTRPKVIPTVSVTSCDAALPADKNAGLQRAGSGTTDFGVSIDTRDDIYRSRVRSLHGFFGWAQPLVDDIGGSSVRWTSSTAFSGIGCPELASSALAHASAGKCFLLLPWC